MSKIYVLDTSAIVDKPTLLYSFNNSTIVIPFVVLEELDKLKTFNNDAAKNARLAIKFLDNIFKDGNIADVQTNSRMKIDFDYENIFEDMSYGDNQIVACALKIKNGYKKDSVTIVTSDINLKVKAKGLGLSAEPPTLSKSILDMFPYMTISEDIDLLTKVKTYRQAEDTIGLENNTFVLFEDENKNNCCLSRKHADGKIKLVSTHNPWGISAKNKDQACLMDLIMDPNIDLVTALGIAGSGKTLVAIACALELVLERKLYDKLIIYRPIQETGEAIGYLPGTQEEKLAPYFTAIMDTFEFLFSSSSKNTDWKKNLEMYIKKGKIQLDSITYIRGRSIPNSLIILDEAQNISSNDMKTFLTRIGRDSKIIALGDTEQIDAEKLNAVNNGLTKVVEAFKGSKLYGNVTMTKGERSRLATEAAKLL